jgi:hypothetical protein
MIVLKFHFLILPNDVVHNCIMTGITLLFVSILHFHKSQNLKVNIRYLLHEIGL